jgi:hypothetical protein
MPNGANNDKQTLPSKGYSSLWLSHPDVHFVWIAAHNFLSSRHILQSSQTNGGQVLDMSSAAVHLPGPPDFTLCMPIS